MDFSRWETRGKVPPLWVDGDLNPRKWLGLCVGGEGEHGLLESLHVLQRYDSCIERDNMWAIGFDTS